MARPRRLLTLVAVACLAMVAGCGAGATPLASPTPRPEGTASPMPTAPPTASPTVAPTDAATGSGFFTLPENWTEVELTEATLRSWLAEEADSNPELAPLMEHLLTVRATEQFVFFAYRDEPGPFVDNMNASRDPANGLTLDEAEQVFVPQMMQLPDVRYVEPSRVTLPAGDALLIAATSTTTTESGAELVLAHRGYVVIDDDVMHIVTFACVEGSEACLADVEAIIRSFRP